MQRFAKQLVALALFALVCAGFVGAPVFAQESTSTDFEVDSAMDTFGGYSTSTSFSASQSGNQVGGGESTSSSYAIQSGIQYYENSSIFSQHWRWYGDANDETPTVPLSPENSAPIDVTSGSILKLRVSVANTSNAVYTDAKFRLQYATTSDFSSGAYTVAEAGSCGTAAWCYATSTGGADNAVITTGVLTDSDACSGGAGAGCGTHNTSGTTTSTFTQAASSTTEYEFTLEPNLLVGNTTYFFRLFDTTASSSVSYNNGDSYPSLASSGTTLSFSITGVSSSTSVDGITTSVDTSSSDVAFGALALGSPLAAAQQMLVSTNASEGYSIYAFQQQGLVGSGSDQIPPVAGTNQSPTSWSSGCNPTASGCYGYHTDASVLSGGSTRFAPDDTFAQFSTAPAEVAYSSGPVTDATTTLLYRVEANNAQPADDYSTGIVYIIVPTF